MKAKPDSRILFYLSLGFSVLLLLGAVGLGLQAHAGAKNSRLLSQLAYSCAIKTTIAWNNSIYEVTDIDVAAGQLDSQVATVKRQVSPRPEFDGDIAINIADSPGQLAGGGLAVFAIKGLDSRAGVALQIDDDRICFCRYYCALCQYKITSFSFSNELP
jgi:hypothetical protein